MPEIHQKNDEEIDLVESFRSLWNGKWKILIATFFTSFIGWNYVSNQEESYTISYPFEFSSGHAFVKYSPLNDLLKRNDLLIDKDNNYGYIFNNVSIRNIVIAELMDYEEIINAINTTNYVKSLAKGLNEHDKKKILFSIAKSFRLESPTKKRKSWLFTFDWHNREEALHILELIFSEVLENSKNVLRKTIEELADVIEVKKSNNLEELQNIKSQILLKQKKINEMQIRNLVDLTTFMKEVDIQGIKLDENGLPNTSEKLGLLLTNSVSFDAMDFLKLLTSDAQLKIMRNHSQADPELKAHVDLPLESLKDLLKISQKINDIQNNRSPSVMRGFIKILDADNPKEWIQYNPLLSNITSNNKNFLYIALSSMIGLFIGVAYVLFQNAITKEN